LVLEKKLSVDSLFREFSDSCLKGAGMEKRMQGGSRKDGGGLAVGSGSTDENQPRTMLQNEEFVRRDRRNGNFEFVRSYSDAVRRTA
jgi:hypothetical protein